MNREAKFNPYAGEAPCDVDAGAAPDRRSRHELRRLILAGTMMAERLAEIGVLDGDVHHQPLDRLWYGLLNRFRGAAPESIQLCELCGLVDHHCIEGLCPRCRQKEWNKRGSSHARY